MLSVWSVFASLLMAATVQADTLEECQQKFEYRVVEPAPDVPPGLRAFSGVWIGSWKSFPFQGANKNNNPYCGGLVVERIERDGTARTIYFHGPNVGLQVYKPARTRWTGKISGTVLKLPRDASVGVAWEYLDFELKSASQLEGTFRGIQSGSFSKR
jgi:hypothetical protein